MVRIYCTGPVQEWPSDDSDFETENLPGYKKPGAESSESEDNSDDSDYEDSPPANKKRKVVTKMIGEEAEASEESQADDLRKGEDCPTSWPRSDHRRVSSSFLLILFHSLTSNYFSQRLE